jgi:hypothetical protein
MVTKTRQHFWAVLMSVILLITIGIFSFSAVTNAQDELKSLDIEVSENALMFVYDEARVHDDGLPAYGSAFITQGYIYPAGTLDGTNGVLDTGEPEFPDQVIGTWVCYGYLIGDGIYTETGAWVVSTQIFEFDESYDKSTIITSGTELVDLNVTGFRAITGGTNSFRGAQGQQSQMLVGFNGTEGVVLHMNLNME